MMWDTPYIITSLMNDSVNPLFGYKIYKKKMITVISRNIDKVSGFPDIVLIGYSLHPFNFVKMHRNFETSQSWC